MTTSSESADAAAAIASGRTVLGIEFGSTRIKACLIGEDFAVLATGSHPWESEPVDGHWSYPLDAVWGGLQACYADLVSATADRYGVRPTAFRAMGISAMMHGYLAFDSAGSLLVPFRTWRDTTTGRAAAELTAELGFNIPLRWSVAHLYQAVLDGEEHVPRVAAMTSLAGYVHWQLTGEFVTGVGDASGIFPIDPEGKDYDADRLARAEALISRHLPGLTLRSLLPRVLPAGSPAGQLTVDGARLLDPTGELAPGVPLCPPEGDGGTGMVATDSLAPRTGNVSVGTSIFAMVTLERPLTRVHPEVDIITTPHGAPVAMVHCNNGATELEEWARVFARFAGIVGAPVDADTVFAALLNEALAGDPNGGGLLAYNFLAGEPVLELPDGRPMLVRTPGSRLTLANFARVQVYSVFAALSIGMAVLDEEGVSVDRLRGHGGLFRTPLPAQRLLAAAVRVPIGVAQTAGEGGAWGIALLAAYLDAGGGQDLAEFLSTRVFADESASVVQPDAADIAGFASYLERYSAALAAQRAAVAAMPVDTGGA